MAQLAEYEKIQIVGITIRKLFMEHIKNETAKGNKINSQLDGRIYILE